MCPGLSGSSGPAASARAAVVPAGPPFFQSAIFQLADEICLASSISWSSAHASPATNIADIARLLVGWRVVGWTWLQADRCVGVEVSCDSLQSRGNAVCQIHS